MTTISERQIARLYIYKKQKKSKRFYIQKARHFVKSKTISVTFLYTKIWTLCVTQFFIEFLKLAVGGGHFYMQKNALCITFYMQRTIHLALRFYIEKF